VTALQPRHRVFREIEYPELFNNGYKAFSIFGLTYCCWSCGCKKQIFWGKIWVKFLGKYG